MLQRFLFLIIMIRDESHSSPSHAFKSERVCDVVHYNADDFVELAYKYTQFFHILAKCDQQSSQLLVDEFFFAKLNITITAEFKQSTTTTSDYE